MHWHQHIIFLFIHVFLSLSFTLHCTCHSTSSVLRILLMIQRILYPINFNNFCYRFYHKCKLSQSWMCFLPSIPLDLFLSFIEVVRILYLDFHFAIPLHITIFYYSITKFLLIFSSTFYSNFYYWFICCLCVLLCLLSL